MNALHALLLAIVLQQAPSRVCQVRHFAEARYRAPGYDHIVHIVSGCDFPLRCVVRTDVNPDPVPADVPPRGHVEVLTWRGSPAYVFTHTIVCGPA